MSRLYDLDEDKENSFVLISRKKTLTRPIACGCAIFGMSKSYIVEMWYKLIDKFGADTFSRTLILLPLN